jgi:hypothetical protein
VRRYSTSELRWYRFLAAFALVLIIKIFSTWLTALAFVGVLAGGAVIALILRRSEKDGL